MSVSQDVDAERDPFYANCSRAQRRSIFAQERRERSTGKWSPWERITLPEGRRISDDPDGWTQDVHTVFRNGWLVVMVRDCNTRWGIVQHAGITTAMRGELCWREKQRVKDELFSVDATAIEVFPTRENLVDAAMMFHMWILPPDAALPFGLGTNDPCSHRHYRPGAQP